MFMRSVTLWLARSGNVFWTFTSTMLMFGSRQTEPSCSTGSVICGIWRPPLKIAVRRCGLPLRCS